MQINFIRIKASGGILYISFFFFFGCQFMGLGLLCSDLLFISGRCIFITTGEKRVNVDDILEEAPLCFLLSVFRQISG